MRGSESPHGLPIRGTSDTLCANCGRRIRPSCPARLSMKTDDPAYRSLDVVEEEGLDGDERGWEGKHEEEEE